MSKKTSILYNIAIGSIFPIAILITWEILVRTEVLPSQSITTPSSSFIKFFEMLFDSTFWGHVSISVYRLIWGFLLGCFFGTLLGGLVGYWKLASKLLEPTFLTLIPVPPIAWIPFFIALLGLGDITKIVLVSLGGFSTLFIATAAGVRSTDKKLLEVASVFKKSQKEIIEKIIFPSTLKYIFANLRIAMALSWTLLLASEMINASSGIGWLIRDARRFYRPEEMIVGIIAIGILGKVTDFLLVTLSNYYTRWDTKLGND